MFKVFFALLSTVCIASSVFSQGKISGTVTDGDSKSTFPGVKITLVELSKNVLSDIDGNYTFNDIPEGKYSVQFSYSTYLTKTELVTVVDKTTTNLNVTLELEVAEVEVVEVVHTVDKGTGTSLILLQKNNAGVVDVMSSEQMKKSGDSKVSDVLKRISGASVQDNKFVVIRGLSDRYNFALINGAPLPSSESDRKAFSFDIFPSNMLDNIVIMKSATPNLPGEFAGGVIDINTITPKQENFHSIQLSGAYNTITTFKDFMTYEGGKADFLGFGARERALPADIPASSDFATLTKEQKGALAGAMDFSWNGIYRKAMPNLGLQYTLGKNFELKNDSEFGFAFAYNYQNNFSTNQVIRREFEEQAEGVILKSELNDTAFTQSVLNSAMLNLKYSWKGKNTISFKNMYSVNSDNRVNLRHGVRELDNDPHQFEKSTNFWYTQNNLLSNQLLGAHDLKVGKLNWNLGFSDVSRNIPNLRRVIYRKYALEENDPNEQYVAVVQNNGTIPTAAGNMFWSTSKEKIYSASYDYSLPFGNDTNKVEFKAGGMHQYRTRDFVARNFGFSQYKPTGSTFNSQLLLLPEDEIFAPENLGLLDDGQGGFKLDEASSVDDSYQASSLLSAGYLMADAKFLSKFRIIGGARIEAYNQKFNYIEAGSNIARAIDTTVIDLLPSVNLVYSPVKKINVRASYYRTISRPEFRELAPFAFYNFIQDNILSGNPNLKRATINNYDLRFEYFPGKGQIMSISGFYKDFTNSIELVNRTGTSGAPELYYTNVSKAQNIGMEVEFRSNFGFMSKDENSILNDFVFYTNLSLIKSSVKTSDVIGSGGDRPLQGQSPFIINSGLYFTHPTQDWSVNLSYNFVAQRIYIVGNVQEPTVWENGRHVVDLQLSKTFKKRFEVKLNVKDLLANRLVLFQDLNGNSKFDNKRNKNPFVSSNPSSDDNYLSGPDNVWQEVSFGQTISLSLKYNFGVKELTPKK